MKFSQVAAVTLVCILGLLMFEANAQYGYGYYPYSYYNQNRGGGWGNGGFLVLIGCLFVILVLFGGFFGNTGSSTSSVTVYNMTD